MGQLNNHHTRTTPPAYIRCTYTPPLYTTRVWWRGCRLGSPSLSLLLLLLLLHLLLLFIPLSLFCLSKQKLFPAVFLEKVERLNAELIVLFNLQVFVRNLRIIEAARIFFLLFRELNLVICFLIFFLGISFLASWREELCIRQVCGIRYFLFLVEIWRIWFLMYFRFGRPSTQ